MASSDSQGSFSGDDAAHNRKYLEVLPAIPTELMPSTLFYSMQRTERGLVIIFNHESFDEVDGKKADGRRHGTSEDVKRLDSTFYDLGFKVVVEDDLTYQEITAYILDVSKKPELEGYDCLVVFVLTHGGKDEIIRAKDNPYYVKELVEPFTGRNCMQLANKPKLFFIQACKGNEIQRGIELMIMKDGGLERKASETSVCSIPEISDVLVAFATIEGYVALRDPTTGTPYVQCLCDELRRYGATEHLLTLLIRVHHRLATSTYHLGHPIQQITVQPSFFCYLNRFVRFDSPSFRSQTQ